MKEDEIEKMARQKVVTEYKGSLEQFAVDNWKAGYAAATPPPTPQDEKYSICRNCNGTGKVEDFLGNDEPCIDCDGKGKVLEETPTPVKEEGYVITGGPVVNWDEALWNELLQLRQWKKEAIEVMPDFQVIGKLLGIKIGESVHDKIIPGIKKLIGTSNEAGANELEKRCKYAERVAYETSKKNADLMGEIEKLKRK